MMKILMIGGMGTISSAIGPYSQAIKVGNVAVKTLPKGTLVEFEVVAEL